jgi:hypothetical protein
VLDVVFNILYSITPENEVSIRLSEGVRRNKYEREMKFTQTKKNVETIIRMLPKMDTNQLYNQIRILMG